MDKKYEQARREGMAYALRIAKEKGIDGLEEELKYRNCTEMPIGISRYECEEVTAAVKHNCIDTCLILAASTLHDEFDFGKTRILRFRDRFNNKAECIMDDYSTWEDEIQVLAEEVDVVLGIRDNNKNIYV